MIKKTSVFTCKLASAILLTSMFTVPALAKESLSAQINKIIPISSQTAVWVQEIASNTQSHSSVLFKKNTRQYFLPASTMKLLTAVAANSYFGADFTFKTVIYSNAPIIQGKLNGDLFIAFDGDPSLTQQDVYLLFEAVKKMGLTTITGDVYLVSKDENKNNWRAPGWSWEDLPLCYAAPLSQYSIDQNCIKAQLTPNKAIAAAQLHLEQVIPVNITSNAIYTPNNKDCDLELIPLPDNQFHLTGCFSKPNGLKLQIAITDPKRYAEQVLAQVMSSLGIELKGQFIQKETHIQPLQPLATHSSAPLSQLLDIMLSDSNNFIADSLVKKMGQKYDGQDLFKQGIKALKAELRFLGIDLSQATIIDGSGLSRYTLITASQLASVLQLIATDHRFQYLIQALPISGIRGTLQHRQGFNLKRLKGRVIAKTGTLKGVDNLAGFINTQSGKQFLFVSLENGISPPSKQNKRPAFNVRLTELLAAQ
ncbi:D-alanyl-D-alanine carboxypeptidase/D-alanyl-D-alanine-endopeptidase [uncultured Shewanella sp.]|uniref:D-alanyl-D-alanine carboxypeptidase/D-alanyl-D-alanine endopeptidase n=1 Tax=uncultured Shewanella sp. TaxID=173975 RepID=UPI00261E8EAD|nr:D-alanyl-D-alanine carboxypeptidase/D-alanyl-D-alanine-endopeptidase [uncultured Shewanella sp.]